MGQEQMPRRVSERKDDDVLHISSDSTSLEEQLEQIQLQLQKYQQQQQILTRRVSDWNNIVTANDDDDDHHHQQQHYKHRNSIRNDNSINGHSNKNFDCYVKNENKQKYGRRC